MNLTNVIHLLQETQTKIKIVYGNTKSTQNTAYIKAFISAKHYKQKVLKL